MKIKLLLIALFLSIGMMGCDDDSNPCTNYTEQEKAKKYELVIGSLGGKIEFINQGQHFKVSEIVKDKGIYYYQPQDGFVGADSVKIKVSKDYDGRERGHITIYKIKFDITECGIKVSENKEVNENIVGTWKCIGFGNPKTSEIKLIEPQDCEECFTMTFKEDGTFEGYSSTVLLSGNYEVHGSGISLSNRSDSFFNKVEEMGDGGKFRIAASLIGGQFSISRTCLEFYHHVGYHGEEQSLLFKRKSK